MRQKIRLMMPMVIALVSLMGCTVRMNGSGMADMGSVSNGKESQATVKKSVKIGKFSKISSRSGIKVLFTQGKFTGEAQVSTTPSAEKYLDIRVDGDELMLSYRSHPGNINGPTIVRVQAPVLEGVDLTSAAKVEVVGNLDIVNTLTAELTSASSLVLNDATGKEIQVEMTSASSFTAGKLNLGKLDVQMTSATTVAIGKVVATEMELVATSASRFAVGAFDGDELEVGATSGSDVRIKGIKASYVDVTATSGADILLEGLCGELSADTGSGGTVNSVKLSCNKGDGHPAGSGMTPPRRL